MSNSLKKTLRISNIRKKSFFFFVLLLAAVSIADVLAIGLVPLILIAFEDESRLPNIILNNDFYSIESLLFILIFIFLFKLFFSIYSQRLLIKYVSSKQAELTSKLLKNYQNYSYLDFVNSNPNLLVRNLINSIPLFINQSLYAYLKLISEAFIALSIIAIIFYVNWFVPILTLAIFSLFGGVFLLLTRTKIKKYGEEMLDAQASLYEISKKSIEGYEEIKTSNLSNFFIKKFDNFANVFTKSGANYYGLLVIPRQMIEAAFAIIFSLSLIVAIKYGFSYSEIIPIAGAIAVAAIRLIPLISNLINFFNDIKFSSTARDHLFNELFGSSIVSDKYKYFSEPIDSITGENISFSYKKKEVMINKLSFHISKGKVLGLFGKSGSGKSTLVRIILGMISPKEGEIIINREIKLSKSIVQSTILTQENFIFNGTILENITLGSEGSIIDNVKVNKSIKLAGLNDFIETLKSREQTVVGDRGQSLSGGQKQRLSIARVFYSSNDVLVLDEPTASLDDKNANLIFDSIEKLKKEKIIILVTHDKKLMELCDEVIHL